MHKSFILLLNYLIATVTIYSVFTPFLLADYAYFILQKCTYQQVVAYCYFCFEDISRCSLRLVFFTATIC